MADTDLTRKSWATKAKALCYSLMASLKPAHALHDHAVSWRCVLYWQKLSD